MMIASYRYSPKQRCMVTRAENADQILSYLTLDKDSS